MQLVIVESPTKARTLSKFLGKDYQIEATLGHIRDLPTNKFAVDLEHDFAPDYVVAADKKKIVAFLKKLAKDATSVVLATDPDREGEAIAYHVAVVVLGKKSGFDTPSGFKRVVFHEITKHAIDESFTKPRGINMNLVHAQQARRVLDRIVGYKLSPLLWKKSGKRWLSAGRVQSITVRLIVEREREREKFTSEEYWRISSKFIVHSSKDAFDAELVSKDGKKYEVKDTHDLFDGDYTVTKTTIAKEAAVKKIIADFTKPYTVSAVDKHEVTRTPAAPFTTSTLQQTAHRVLGFSSKRTMSVAQRLYEKGLITYHRTDSVHLSDKFILAAREFITKEYGKEYALAQARAYKGKAKLAQEAHEAIRPTKIESRIQNSESRNKKELNRDHVRLYDLIWKRAVASQSANAVFDATTIKITDKKGYEFHTNGSIIKFDGYLRITGRQSEDRILPNVAVGDTLDLTKSNPEQKFSDPPPRYSEAKLIHALEEHGIGRPSTYAPTISTVVTRQYVELNESRQFVPTDLGTTVNDFLVKHFGHVVNLPFTAEVEDELDDIAHGKHKWVDVLRKFYTPFAKTLEKTEKTAKKVKVPVEKIDEKCPKCKKQLVIRLGRYGKFISCSTFPECDFTKNIVEKIDMPCPDCGGDIIVKHTRRKKVFYGCINYPKCSFASWTKPKA